MLSNQTVNRIYGNAGTHELINQSTIEGAGQIGANSMKLTNDGLIEANQSNSLTVDLSSAGIHNGTFKASRGGTLIIKDNFSGAGAWDADGGKIQLDSVDITTTGDISIANGGELELNGSNLTGGDLTLDSTGILDVNSSVSLAGDFSFALTSADTSGWQWDSASSLGMTGGGAAAAGQWNLWSSLEIGGNDLGTNPATHVGHPSGFQLSNFYLPTLELGADARLFLNDGINNGYRGGALGIAEALYVDTLVLSAGSLLNLNDLHLYYNNLVGDVSQIIDNPVVVVPIPEAPSWALLGLGLIGGVLLRRRQKMASEGPA